MTDVKIAALGLAVDWHTRRKVVDWEIRPDHDTVVETARVFERYLSGGGVIDLTDDQVRNAVQRAVDAVVDDERRSAIHSMQYPSR